MYVHTHTPHEHPLQDEEMERASSKTTRQGNPQSSSQHSTQHQQWIWGVQRNTHADPHTHTHRDKEDGQIKDSLKPLKLCELSNYSG